MQATKQKEKKMNFVATPLSLPLFMVSRNCLKYEQIDKVRGYIKKESPLYVKNCQTENKTLTATFKYNRHITGLENVPKKPYPEQRPLKFNRSLYVAHDWQQAPNRYGIPSNPFAELSGSKGAIFAKLHTQKSLLSNKPTEKWCFYEIPSDMQRMVKPENAHKGVFLSNARSKRATQRNMITDLQACYRDSNDPGPTTYYSKYFELAYNATPPAVEPLFNPHIFYPHSCVPTKPSTLIKKNISFLPGPGRYEVHNANICPCPARKIYMPGLQLIIDEQKRLKFRRLPYYKIRKRLYCSPDWTHVKGHGFRYLFHFNKKKFKAMQKKYKIKKVDKQLKLYADAKYINMIVNPRRTPISIREFPLEPYVPKIVYNCIARHVVRKQLRNNKKIAFNSGQERFKDAERPLQITAKQLEEIKMRLPPERRLVDHPIEVSRKSQIDSRLHHVPEHMKPTYVPKLRKRLFKFLPLPGAKVLVADSDIRPDIKFDHENPLGYYRKKFDERFYFRDSVLDAMSEVISPPVIAMSSYIKTEVGDDKHAKVKRVTDFNIEDA